MDSSNNSRKLILYFDINKTVLISDKVKGLDLRDCIKELTSQYAWGEVDDQNKWSLKHPELVFQCPNEKYISYYDYLEKNFPLQTEKEESNKAKRAENNLEIKKNKRKLRRSLISEDSEGDLKKLYGKFQKIEESAKLSHFNIPKKEFPDYFDSGYVNIVPSFFYMMINLQKQNREFSIIFRTFGSDLEEISKEFNDFCNGIHPLFNGENGRPLAQFNGKDGTKNYLIDTSSSGMIYRTGKHIDDTVVILGSNDRKPLKLSSDDIEQLKNNKSLKVIIGAENIYNHLKEKNSFGIQDDYCFWNENNEKFEFAKPLLVNTSDSHILPIFFDDNIQANDDCIIDCRNIHTKEQIHLTESLNKHLIKVDSFLALSNDNYFLEMISVCEKAK